MESIRRDKSSVSVNVFGNWIVENWKLICFVDGAKILVDFSGFFAFAPDPWLLLLLLLAAANHNMTFRTCHNHKI